MPASLSNSTGRLLLQIAALAATFPLIGVPTLWLASIGVAMPFSPHTGFVYWALFVGGLRLWPGIIVGSTAGSMLLGRSLDTALLFALGNAAQAVIGAAAMRRLYARGDRLDQVRGVFLFAVIVAALPQLIGAALGVFTMVRAGMLGPQSASGAFVTWWAGNALAVLVVTPFLVAWTARRPPSVLRPRWEVLLAAATLAGLLGVVNTTGSVEARQIFAFLPLPVLLWLAVRSGRRAALTALLVTAVVVAVSSRLGAGPFASSTPREREWMLELFIFLCAVSTLVAVALVEEQRASQERLSLLFSRNPIGLAAWNEDGTIVNANRAFVQISGFDAAEVAAGGTSLSSLTPMPGEAGDRSGRADQAPGGDGDAWWRPLSGSDAPVEVRLRRGDGTMLPALIASARWREGDPGGFTAVLDLREREALDRDRRQIQRQRERFERLDALATLAGGIAHDFNNVLMGISANAELLLDDPGNATTSASEIRRASLRARDLVGQLLTFSRRDLSAGGEVTGVYDPAPIVQEALSLVRASFPSSIELRAELAPALPTLRGDPSQLHQVVVNLATNALHALRGATHGWLAVRLVEERGAPGTSAAREHLLVRLEVADNGVGMDEATLDRVFEPFFTTKPPGEGSGLGLAVVHGIVTRYGGTIDVVSSPNTGTSVVIRLPGLDGVPPAPVRVVAAVPSRPRRLRVFLVDDESGVAHVTARLLERSGFTVSVFTDPREALAAFERAPETCEALVTDLTMPALAGPQLAAAMQARRPGLPAILISGNTSVLGAEDARCFAHVVQKPFAIEALVGLLARLPQPEARDRAPGPTPAPDESDRPRS